MKKFVHCAACQIGTSHVVIEWITKTALCEDCWGTYLAKFREKAAAEGIGVKGIPGSNAG